MTPNQTFISVDLCHLFLRESQSRSQQIIEFRDCFPCSAFKMGCTYSTLVKHYELVRIFGDLQSYNKSGVTTTLHLSKVYCYIYMYL